MKKLAIGLFLIFCITLSGFSAGAHDVASMILGERGQSVVKLTFSPSVRGGGTGFQVQGPSGRPYVMTNGHVCEGSRDSMHLYAELPGSKRHVRLKILAIAETTDLCLLEGLPGGGPSIPIAADLEPTEHLYVIGHPHLNNLTLSDGYVIGREIVDIIEERVQERCVGPGRVYKEVPLAFGIVVPVCIRSLDAIDVTALIFPGSSGSPIMNSDGELVGVIFAAHNGTNYGSFVPLDVVVDFLSIY